ncbi:acyl carrier protein [Maribellus mangrovi]|uniref:acyl carrier protein n=1 Tax=Maribellus mangrovi TaxID=3133146 RepID=UPI0030EDA78A
MNREKIIEKVNEFLSEEFEIDADKLVSDAHLKDDLAIESLDFVDIVIVVEKEFGIKVNNEDLLNIQLLSDLYAYIEAQMGKVPNDGVER